MVHSSARLVGLISDTHGLVRPAVHDALKGVELILHAGDVGGLDVLEELRLIAPIRAVFGNTDAPGDPDLSQELELTLDGVTVHVSHGHELGSPTPAKLAERYSADIVVYGHTHKQLVTRIGGRLIVNPGAAGPRRFDLKPSVARLEITEGETEVEIIDIT
jgi:putative phosphoesterase